MSSAARFLLEFEATGDQEVVNKIREVGAAGKETAAELQSLQGIEDPFAPIAAGAESAVAPIEGVGTASTETAATMGELVTEGEAVTTGMTEMGTATEEAGSKSESFGSSLTTVTSGIAAIGGAIGSAVSAYFRYADAQNKVVKAQAMLTRATETHRKAEAGLDAVLSKATSNTAGIAAARDRLSAAQAKVNQLMDEGVTSGQEFEAAQTELTAAQQGLSAAAQGTGVDMAKLATAMGSAENSAGRMAVAANALEAANRKSNEAILDQVFGIGSLAGSFIQVATSTGKWGGALKTAGSSLKNFGGTLKTIGPFLLNAALLGSRLAAVIAGPLVIAAAAGIQAFQLFRGIPKLFQLVNAAIEGNVKKAAGAYLELMQIAKQAAQFNPLGGAAIIPLYDNMIKKLKEVLKEKKIEVETNDVTIDSWEELKQTIKGMPAEYQPILNAIMGVTTETKNSAVAANDMSNAAGLEEKAIQSAGTVTAQAATDFDKIAASSDNAAIAFAGVANRVDGFNLRMGEESQTIEEAKGTLAGYNDVLGIVGPSLVGLTGTTDNAVVAWGKLVNIQGETKTAVANSAIAFNELVNHAHAGGEAIRVYSTEAENAVDPSANLDDEVSILGEDLDESGAQAQKAAHDLLTLADSSKNVQEALDQNHLAYAQSVDKLADMNAVMSDTTAHFEAVQTAVNGARVAVMQESIDLEAAGQIAADVGIQNQELANSYTEGALSISEWVNALAQSKQEQQGQIDMLAALGLTFDDLPSAMEPTIENLKLYGAALNGTSEDAKAWAEAQSAAYATVQEAGNELVNNLSDALVKGGESMGDITDKWLEDMPEMLRERLSEAQIVALQGMAELQALAKTNKLELEADLKTESLDKARNDFVANIKEMGNKAKPEFKKIYDEAAKIAEKGTADQMHRVAQILESDDPWPVMLENLKAIKLEQEGAKMGKALMNAYAAAIKGSSSAVSSAVLAASAAANVAPKTEKVIKPGAAAKVDVDTTAAHAKLSALHKALTAITQIVVAPKIDVDATAAQGKLTALHQALTAITQITVAPKIDVDAAAAASKLKALHSALTAITKIMVAPKIDANITAAMTKIKQTQTALNAIKQTRIPTVRVNPAQALSQIKNVGTQLNAIKQTRIPTVRVNNSQALSQINRVKSALNGLKNITRTITYRYRTVGSPPRGAQSGMHERLAEDTLIAAHKGERVDISPTGGPAIEKPGPTHNIISEYGGAKPGANVTLNIPVLLDGKVITRIVRRHLIEDATGGM
jgi:hypothetical protein